MKYCDSCGEEAQNTMVMCAKCGNRGFSDMPVTAASPTNTAPQTPNTSSHSNTSTNSTPTASQVASSSSIGDIPAGWLSTPPTPWRRYAARILDVAFLGGLGFIIIAIVYYSVAPYSADQFFSIFEQVPAGPIIDAITTAFVGSVLSGVVIGLTGSSLGKVIFGLIVVDKHGKKIGLADGIRRDLAVYLRGMGLAIPLVSFVTLYLAFRMLKDTGSTSWDADNEYQVWHRPSGQAQYVLNVLGIILIFAISAFYRML